MGKKTTTGRLSNSYPGKIKNDAKLFRNQTNDDRNGIPELRAEYKKIMRLRDVIFFPGYYRSKKNVRFFFNFYHFSEFLFKKHNTIIRARV